MLLHDVARNRDMPNLVLLDKKETIKVCAPVSEVLNSNFPLRSVDPPSYVPSRYTLAPGIGVLDSSVTIPETEV